jgi:hypothetical protein
MIDRFKDIKEEEFTQLKDALALITVLIAGADGEINQHEKEWGSKITDIRSYSGPAVLQEFYEQVGIDYEDRVEYFINKYNIPVKERQEKIGEELAKLNDILQQLPQDLAAHLYKSYKSFASHVAKSDGGFLGFFSVSEAEKTAMSLSTITPVDFPEEI